jgi:hypothetical protein
MKVIPKIEEFERKLTGWQYRQLITEELSIADNVKRVANDIFNFILQSRNITSIRNIGFIGSANLILKQFDFDDIDKVENFDPDCTYVRPSNNAGLDENNKLYGISFEFEYATLNGDITDYKLLNLLYHEVEHAYQDYMKLSIGVNTIYSRRNELNNFAVDYYNHGNYYLKSIATILYLSDRNEQDAFAHQVYSTLKSKKASNIPLIGNVDILMDINI